MAATEIFGRVPRVIKHDFEVMGVLKGTTISGPLTTPAQPGVTSLGVLTGLTMGGVLNMGGHGLISLPEPSSAQDAATKNYVDNHVQDLSLYMLLDGSRPLTGTLQLGGHDITGVGSLGTTGARLTKGWFTDLQVTHPINGDITGNAATASLAAVATAALVADTAGAAATAADLSATLSVAHGGTGQAATPGNGNILIGNGSGFTLTNLTGTARQVAVTPGVGTITLSGPQDLATTSTVTFAQANLQVLAVANNIPVTFASVTDTTTWAGPLLTTPHDSFRADYGGFGINNEVLIAQGADGFGHTVNNNLPSVAAVAGAINVPTDAQNIAFNAGGFGVAGWASTTGSKNAVAVYAHSHLTGNVGSGTPDAGGGTAGGQIVSGSIWGLNAVLEDVGWTGNYGDGAVGMIGAEFDFNLSIPRAGGSPENVSVPWGVDVIGGGMWYGNSWDDYQTFISGTSQRTALLAAIAPASWPVRPQYADIPKFVGRTVRGSRGFSVRPLRTDPTANETLVSFPPSYKGISKWHFGLHIQDGAAVEGIHLGSQTQVPSADPTQTIAAGSMPIIFLNRPSASGAALSSIFIETSGNMILRPANTAVRIEMPNTDMTALGTYVGTSLFVGNLLVPGTKSFEIPHPDPSKPEGTKLRHSAIEGPTRGDTLYRFRVELDYHGHATIRLPEYFPFLNTDADVWASGGADAAVSDDLTVVVVRGYPYQSAAVLVIATRNDPHAHASWDELGAEYVRQD